MDDEGGGKKEEQGEQKIIHTYPLIRQSDMSEEVKADAVEIAVTACEKHAANNEAAAKMIKETMDKKFGPSWQVVVGEGYGFKISYQVSNLLYLYFGGNTAICMWKCS